MIAMETKPILVCAPSKWEALPLADRWRLRTHDSVVFEGRSGAKQVTVLRTGMGAERAALTLSSRGCARCYSAAVSVGFAGALQPGIDPGDLVADLRGADAELPPAARAAAENLGAKLHFGKIVESSSVLGPAAKRELGLKERAAAVDMETEAIRRWAAAAETPVYAVRVVLDGLGDALPDMPSGEDAAALAGYLARRPLQIPRLAALGVRQMRAMKTLSMFLDKFLELI